MGGGKSKSKSKAYNLASGNSNTNSAFDSSANSASNAGYSQNVWGAQSPYLQELYGTANNLFQTSQDPNLIQNTQTNMAQVPAQSNDAWNNQLNGGVYQDMNAQDNLNTLMGNGVDTNNTQRIYGQIMGGEGNNYADAMRDQYVKDANRASDNLLSNLDARAAAAGMSGGSRHGVLEGIGERGINDALQSNLAKTGFDTFNDDLNQKLKIAQMADANQLARYQGDQKTLMNVLNNQQSGIQGAINQTGARQDLQMNPLAPTMLPFKQLNAVSGVLGNPTILGSGTQTANSSEIQKAISDAYNTWKSNGTAKSSGKSIGGGV